MAIIDLSKTKPAFLTKEVKSGQTLASLLNNEFELQTAEVDDRLIFGLLEFFTWFSEEEKENFYLRTLKCVEKTVDKNNLSGFIQDYLSNIADNHDVKVALNQIEKNYFQSL